ncbi:MAG: hypothetical protein ACI4VK_05430 [Candidatus Coproplasma sp.]
MSEGTYLYTLTQETRELSKYEWKVEKVLYDDATVERLMEQANKYYLKHYYREYYESFYDDVSITEVKIVPEILLVDNGELIGFYIQENYLLLSEVEGGSVTLRWDCTSHGDTDSGKEEYVYIYTKEYYNNQK